MDTSALGPCVKAKSGRVTGTAVRPGMKQKRGPALGNANRPPGIFGAGKPMLTDPDRTYPGQILRSPSK